MRYPCQQTYALRLSPGSTDDVAGEVEHVLSGERMVFVSGPELLAALRRLQSAQGAQAVKPAPAAG